MALITCPECGGKVSSESTACPHCGYPMKKFQQQKKPAVEREISGEKKKIILLVAIGIAVIAVVLLLYFIIANDGNYVMDICGNKYKVVKIGEQYWMAENLRCAKYDTESEAYNAPWLTNNTIPTSNDAIYTPYYTDASDKSKWHETTFAYNLTDAQVAKLGYIYNWAASVGVADGSQHTTAFTGTRQGICPNGWHVPTRTEWQMLYDYIYDSQMLTSNQVGKYLKTTSGWYENGDRTDTYGFAALPAGYADGSSVSNVGYDTDFWTATPHESYISDAYARNLVYSDVYLTSYLSLRYTGRSVRCLRNQ